MTNSMTPVVAFEELDPADLSSALGSLTRLRRWCVTQPKVGIGYESFLRWALRDIEEADSARSGDDCERASVNAVMNARRALSCLIDQYLQRDGFRFCQRPPREA